MTELKKQMYIAVGISVLIITLFTVTYAFFNYTRTGLANVIRSGRIAFNSEQGTSINLTNVFPIDVTNGIPNNDSVGSVTIHVTGDTTYSGGIEYLVSAVNVENTVGSGNNSKNLPISIDVSVEENTTNSPSTTLGTESDAYFTNRGSTTSYYKVLAGETINNDDKLVVGYIASGSTGVNGNIVIRAYLDASKVAISDTYDESDPETDNMGTTTDWVDDRVVFTTSEWNSLQTNGLSFKVKVEANEGIWVDAPLVIPTTMAEMCPDCVFMCPDCVQNISTDYNLPYGTVLSAGDYDTDYTETIANLSNDYFAGFKLNETTSAIEKAYACGLNNGTAFCIEAPLSSYDSNTKSVLYTKNQGILENVFGVSACAPDYLEWGNYKCVGSSIFAYIDSDYVSVHSVSDDIECFASTSTIICY